MALPQTTALSLAEIETLALTVFRAQGCDEDNTAALARTVTTAERDGSVSHGLFRVPGYVASLRSGKVNGSAKPQVSCELPSVVSVDGDMGFAPLALETGLPVLADAALKNGIAVMRLVNNFHFAALWPETEYLAGRGLMGLACTAFKPTVAPAGATQAFLAPTRCPLLGRVQDRHRLFLIWRHPPLLKVMCRLQPVMGMMSHQAQALDLTVSPQTIRLKS